MLSSGRVVGNEIAPERETHRVVSMDFLGRNTRCPRATPSLLQRSSPEQAFGENVTALGRESQFFVSFYFFGSMFYEANEPSSACRLWCIFMVETSTPPKVTGEIVARMIFRSSRLLVNASLADIGERILPPPTRSN